MGKISRVIKSFVGFIRSILSKIDGKDVFFFGGLLLLGYGLYKIDTALPFIVDGSILILVGLGYLTGSQPKNQIQMPRQR